MSREKRVDKNKKNKKIRIILIILLAIIFLVSVVYLTIHFYNSNKNKQLYEDLSTDIMEEIIKVDSEFIEKVKELQEENSDIVGWIRIGDTSINYPLLQTTDNEYYLTHNYKKEKSSYGSIYINSNSDITDVNSNVIIYGHSFKETQMFKELIKYKDKSFYEEHPIIYIATDEEETEYEIINVFLSKVFYQHETDVFRYYDYHNFENEKEYNEYLKNCKEIELYDTGVIAEYGEQLITLITCEYSQENGRIVVVAKKVK